jgi:hypothetical protein
MGCISHAAWNLHLVIDCFLEVSFSAFFGANLPHGQWFVILVPGGSIQNNVLLVDSAGWPWAIYLPSVAWMT